MARKKTTPAAMDSPDRLIAVASSLHVIEIKTRDPERFLDEVGDLTLNDDGGPVFGPDHNVIAHDHSNNRPNNPTLRVLVSGQYLREFHAILKRKRIKIVAMFDFNDVEPGDRVFTRTTPKGRLEPIAYIQWVCDSRSGRMYRVFDSHD